MWKGYQINGAGILKPKTNDNVEVLQSTGTIDKAAILNIVELLTYLPFVENDQNNNKINS